MYNGYISASYAVTGILIGVLVVVSLLGLGRARRDAATQEILEYRGEEYKAEAQDETAQNG